MDTKTILVMVFAWAFISTPIGLYIIFKKLDKLFPLNIKQELENINEKPIKIFEGTCWRLLIKIHIYGTFLLISYGNKATKIPYNEIQSFGKSLLPTFYLLKYSDERYILKLRQEDAEYIKQMIENK